MTSVTYDAIDTIDTLIAQGEGPALEFKRSPTKDIGRTFCAFANANGGTVLVGVSDAGAAVGVQDHNRLKAQMQTAARSVDPPIDVRVDSVGAVLRITVPPQARKPYAFGGRFFMRIGASSQQLSNEEIENFFYSSGRIRFDRRTCPDFSINEDIDAQTWTTFCRRAKIPEDMAPFTALRNLDLLDRNDQPTNACAWLLGPDIRRFTDTGYISCELFMGSDRVKILDRREIHTAAATMIDEAVAWILSKINVEYVIDAVQRRERPELPEEALREIVANAVAHRDYRSTGNIHIRVFRDRLEVTSPGGLPSGMREEDLGSKSLPRNPLLFSILHRMGVVEKIGSGIQRVRELCRQSGLDAPTMRIDADWVTTTVARRTSTADAQPEPKRTCRSPENTEAATPAPSGHQAGTKSAPSGHQVGTKSAPSEHQVGTKSAPSEHQASTKSAPSEHQASTKSAPSRHQVGTKSTSNDIQARILRECLEERTLRELMVVLGKHDRTKFRNQVIKPLLESGWLEMTVPAKPRSSRQRYRTTQRGREALPSLDEPPAPEPQP